MLLDAETKASWRRRLEECAAGLDLTEQDDRAVFRVRVIQAARDADPQVLLALARDYGRSEGDNRCTAPGCALACGYLDAQRREWSAAR